MALLRAFLRDLRDGAVWRAWWDECIRHVPGELGQALRSRTLAGRLKRVGPGLVVYPGARVFGADKLEVGRNCRIGYDNIIQANGEIVFGDDVLLGPGVKIWSVNHASTRTDVSIWDQGYEHKRVELGDGVWIGANCFVMPGARIGAHSIVAAGSVVAGKDVEPYSILAGNPARKVGSRLERAAVAAAPPDRGA